MRRPVVADASSFGSIILHDEYGPLTELVTATIRTAALHVPQHWPLELANMILSARRRQRLDAPQVEAACAAAERVIVAATIEPTAKTLTLVALALDHGITAYDAAYLELARRLSCPLLTDDRRMAQVAATLSIALIEA